ncbi:MAG: nitroreductase family protein [Spirochaetes bacterium]|nr:nitroreductase family protein [Spirochaetota bacterium]
MRRSAFLDLVAARSSVRRYDAGRPVSDEHLAAILEAARLAPSAGNAQPWRFVVVRDPAVRARLAAEAFSGIYQRTRRIAAPVYLALCGVHGATDFVGRAAGHSSYTLTDCSIAGEHAVLAAVELGLGTCWIGMFNRRRTRRLLGVPAGVDVIAMIALGWPAEPARAAPPAKGRKPLSAIAWLDAWGSPFGVDQSERV